MAEIPDISSLEKLGSQFLWHEAQSIEKWEENNRWKRLGEIQLNDVRRGLAENKEELEEKLQEYRSGMTKLIHLQTLEIQSLKQFARVAIVLGSFIGGTIGVLFNKLIDLAMAG